MEAEAENMTSEDIYEEDPGYGARADSGCRVCALFVMDEKAEQAMALKTYRELEVWQRAMDLVVEVYRLSAEFSVSREVWMTSQIQRAAVSVPANIAEGYGRSHRGDYLTPLVRCSRVARGTGNTLGDCGQAGFLDREERNGCVESVAKIGRC
jgi:four helix bundle protein